MILLVIVGGIFTVIGFVLLYIRYYFLKHASRVWGKVIGLEKTVSRTRSGSNSSSSVTYAPIVEYIFNGEKVWFSAGGSSNNIYKYKIDQRVRVLSLKKGPEYAMLENGVLGIMGTIFFIMGLTLFAFGIYQVFDRPPQTIGDWIWDYGFLLVLIPSGLVTFLKLKEKFQSSDVNISEQMLKAANLETDESLRGRNIYWNRKQLQKEVGSVNKVGYLVSSIFLCLSLVGLYYAWGWMPDSSQKLFENIFKNPESFQKILTTLKKKDPKVVMFLITLFFSTVGTYSFIYSVRKMKK